MLYIPKIDDYFKILTDEKVKDFIPINFSEYFKSTREKLCSKLSEEQNLRKVSILLYFFLTTPVKYKNMCNQILLIIVYIAIMLRFWIFLIHNYDWLILNHWLKTILKKFKVQTILVLKHKKRNDDKIFHSCTNLITSDVIRHWWRI